MERKLTPEEEARARRAAQEHALGAESETGATSGLSHDEVLQRALGRERGLDVASRDGPPPPRRR